MTRSPRPSATVIIVAPHVASDGHEDYRVLMVKRAGGSGFMAGAHVFPGGVLDAADRDPRWRASLALPSGEDLDDETALRITAIRETFEEIGVAIVDGGAGAPLIDLADDRAAVHDDASEFLSVCGRRRWRPKLEALHPWARWITPPQERRRYDARFYVARLESEPEAAHDDAETVASGWFAPSDLLARHAARRLFLPPPTWVTLQELASWPRLDDLVAAGCCGRDLGPVCPHIEFGDAGMILAMPDDPLHPDGPEDGAPHRIVIDAEGAYHFTGALDRAGRTR